MGCFCNVISIYTPNTPRNVLLMFSRQRRGYCVFPSYEHFNANFRRECPFLLCADYVDTLNTSTTHSHMQLIDNNGADLFSAGVLLFLFLFGVGETKEVGRDALRHALCSCQLVYPAACVYTSINSAHMFTIFSNGLCWHCCPMIQLKAFTAQTLCCSLAGVYVRSTLNKPVSTPSTLHI